MSKKETKSDKKPWYKSKLLWLVAIIAIIIIAATVGSKENKDSDGSPKATAGINQPVRDGKFEFKVLKVTDNVDKIVDDFGTVVAHPQGKFVKVLLNVKNISKQSQDFMDDSQYLYDNKGNKIELESNTVNSNENPNNILLMPKVNPGNNATYTLFYDINKDASANKLEVHDSMFSSGATIKLS